MSLEVFASAISQMAEQCPVSGSVTATFTVHDRNVYLKSVVTAVDSDSSADIKKVDFSVKNFAALPVPSSVFSLQGLRLSLFFSAMPSKPNEHLMFCQRLQVYWGLIFI